MLYGMKLGWSRSFARVMTTLTHGVVLPDFLVLRQDQVHCLEPEVPQIGNTNGFKIFWHRCLCMVRPMPHSFSKRPYAIFHLDREMKKYPRPPKKETYFCSNSSEDPVKDISDNSISFDQFKSANELFEFWMEWFQEDAVVFPNLFSPKSIHFRESE